MTRKGRLLLLFILVCIPSRPQKASEELPPLNRAIIDYVNSVMGQQVDRGECWDLANQALTRVNASWDGEYMFGKQVDPNKQKIYPGDIVQFKGVKVEYHDGNTYFTESYKHHTAIVYKVLGKGHFELAHQNTGFSGRKVGVSDFRISTVKKGKMFFYRPMAKD
jgi:hypothetical protein